jgi:hypothetical protein
MIQDGWIENWKIVLDVYMDDLDIIELCWNFDCNFGKVPIDFKHQYCIFTLFENKGHYKPRKKINQKLYEWIKEVSKIKGLN